MQLWARARIASINEENLQFAEVSGCNFGGSVEPPNPKVLELDSSEEGYNAESGTQLALGFGYSPSGLSLRPQYLKPFAEPSYERRRQGSEAERGGPALLFTANFEHAPAFSKQTLLTSGRNEPGNQNLASFSVEATQLCRLLQKAKPAGLGLGRAQTNRTQTRMVLACCTCHVASACWAVTFLDVFQGIGHSSIHNGAG
ncbi:hypothetical protein B0H63DRAFT_54700 [Podospora didyma]|uniref:Uncharacterized protein n=1 Tax=Podospora didyma TaxID=330526 RepID=A0AAE0P7Y8_9PEZI|nr:hypothetical protein B0H63DRAFT_54700 [Podospora didyma]